MKAKIVVIDDDSEMRALLRDYLDSQGHETIEFSLATEALEKFKSMDDLSRDAFDLVITDIRMPEMTGLQFLAEFQKSHPKIPVILITAFGSMESAVEALRQGAHDYVVKPFKLDELGVTVEKALEFRKLQKDNQILRQQVKSSQSYGNIIGKSPAIQAVFDLIERVGGSMANILIIGESGTGKELVAKAIHKKGPRANGPFVAINCAAIPESLLESELFGHARGSFTGAIQKKRGLFEEANGGTIFLDEIGDMPLALQTKILRVLQEKKIRAVGDNTDKEVDVRIIAATHQDLKAKSKTGAFRDDLYYRLSVIPIHIPALKERREDIPLLAEHFLRKYVASNNSKVAGFSKEALRKLIGLPWEGNVRELENVVERAVILSKSDVILPEDLPSSSEKSVDNLMVEAVSKLMTLEELERHYIRLVMDGIGNHKEKVAQTLGINRRTLYRKEREYGLAHRDN